MNDTWNDDKLRGLGGCWQNPFKVRNGFRQPKSSKHRNQKRQQRKN